jgi:hypothetical protein
MRSWLRLLITLIVIAGIGIGAWTYVNRRPLARQWALYRVGAAPTLEAAIAEIAWFESGPDGERKLQSLAGKWGTGNAQFDLYLAEYVSKPQSPEALRRAFSLGLARHEERLRRWVHYWSWHTKQEPKREIASILSYLDLLAEAESSKTITWRQVLSLQAIFTLAGEPGLAKRLHPENWRDRYREWREESPGEFPGVPRPDRPFPDWQGPVPARDPP